MVKGETVMPVPGGEITTTEILVPVEPVVEEVEDDKRSKFVLNQVLGIGKADEKYGKYIAKQFGVASKMFDVGSIQFALHYMFENKFTNAIF
jgi:hypothetical protein